jgi:uroporphyrin-III C-methyltransferase
MATDTTPTQKTTDKTPEKPKHCKKGRTVVLISLLIAIVALIVSIATCVKASRTSETQAALIATQLQTQSTQNALEQTALRNTVNQKLAQTRQKLATLTNNSQGVRTLGEVEYLLRLANLNLTLGSNPRSALKLMGLADQRLAHNDDPSQNHLRAAIINDMQAIRAMPRVDVTGILLQLDGLQHVVDTLKPIPTSMPRIKTTAQKTTPHNWHEKWHAVLGQLKSLVIIRHDDKAIQPLLAPAQFLFLKDNVDLSLAKAEWAVLHKNNTLYQHSLGQAVHSLSMFDSHNIDATTAVTQTLNLLMKKNVTPHYPSILNSLKLVAHMLSSPNTHATQAAVPTPKLQSSTPAPKRTPKKAVSESTLKKLLPATTHSVET